MRKIAAGNGCDVAAACGPPRHSASGQPHFAHTTTNFAESCTKFAINSLFNRHGQTPSSVVTGSLGGNVKLRANREVPDGRTGRPLRGAAAGHSAHQRMIRVIRVIVGMPGGTQLGIGGVELSFPCPTAPTHSPPSQISKGLLPLDAPTSVSQPV